MVWALKKEQENFRAELFHFTGLNENNSSGPRHGDSQSLIPKISSSKELIDIELMKEKFAKLLLGEDMSGGGKGVTSALALSNAITNLAVSFDTDFSEHNVVDLKSRIEASIVIWERKINSKDEK
ncbi:hypothetical protein Nepgr_024058 [Nepenthes gracilis]|uniref:PRONE domain-containing protein n=1 Tax=Nepenthes gracilis TaxID=150966 RepID=A0AAD3XZP3_NEPGR|nr:hypothetical protein Nepgr_024058 [Nepenthes gracilis]